MTSRAVGFGQKYSARHDILWLHQGLKSNQKVALYPQNNGATVTPLGSLTCQVHIATHRTQGWGRPRMCLLPQQPAWHRLAR